MFLRRHLLLIGLLFLSQCVPVVLLDLIGISDSVFPGLATFPALLAQAALVVAASFLAAILATLGGVTTLSLDNGVLRLFLLHNLVQILVVFAHQSFVLLQVSQGIEAHYRQLHMSRQRAVILTRAELLALERLLLLLLEA